jgi:hypothetical protein
MTFPVCTECGLTLHIQSLYLSNDQVFWHVSPHEQDLYNQECKHLEPGVVSGSFGCPTMRRVIAARFPGLQSTSRSADPPGSVAADSSGEIATMSPEASDLTPIFEQFESLGDNSEFGLVQIAARIKPNDLLSVAILNVPIEDRLARLIEAIEKEFAGLGDPGSSAFAPESTHALSTGIVLSENRWGLSEHLNQLDPEPDLPFLHAQQEASLRRKADLFRQGLRSAQRIFVWKSNLLVDESTIRRLAECLRRYGPNLLLWTTYSDPDHPAGTVEYVGNGLLKGYVTRFAPYTEPSQTEYDDWQAVCKSAAQVAELLRRYGEWSAPTSSPMDSGSLMPPLDECRADEVASSVTSIEKSGPLEHPGVVMVKGDTQDANAARWFQENPGIGNVRVFELTDVVLDSACSILIHSDHKLIETRYLLGDEDYDAIQVGIPGLRCAANDEPAIIGFNRPFRNYYHWMMQCLPAIDSSVRDLGLEKFSLALPSLSELQEETLLLLGLSDAPRIDIDISHHYYFSQAYFSEYLNGTSAFYLSPRALRVFHKLAEAVTPASASPERLYVSRRDATNRVVENEVEVERFLEAEGFTSVVPGSLKIADQIRLFKGARIVVGPHGAGMTNLGFCEAGTKVLELFQSTYANPCFNRVAQANHLEYHGEFFPCPATDDPHTQSWSIDINRLAAKIKVLTS